uniref:NR LBD domain-containing protein n=1 Tax=Panagrellus redivivus TaxID=6233 RepID=A0A7E4VWR1_PANRE
MRVQRSSAGPSPKRSTIPVLVMATVSLTPAMCVAFVAPAVSQNVILSACKNPKSFPSACRPQKQKRQKPNSDSACSSLSPYTPPISKIGKLDYTPLLPNTSNAFLNQILYTNDAVFHRRALLLPQTPTGTRPSSLADSAHHATNEAQLFRMFINMSGLNEVIDLTDIMSEIILYWCSAICLVNTLKFDTINDKQFTLIDNSYVEITEESILKWHSSVEFLRRDLQCLARIALPMFTQIEDISRQFRDSFMTPEEMTYFLILSLIEAMIRCSKNSGITRERFQPYMNRLFTSMKQYYGENFSEDSVATRMGRIVMMLPLLNELHDLLGKHRSLLQLCNWRLEHLDNENLYSAFHSMNLSDRS